MASHNWILFLDEEFLSKANEKDPPEFSVVADESEIISFEHDFKEQFIFYTSQSVKSGSNISVGGYMDLKKNILKNLTEG